MVCVSWDDAAAYVKWLSGHTGEAYRLLSEAEWEYVARADTKTKYPCGNVGSCLRKVGWYVVNSKSRTHPVGGKEPNGFGLYDLQGNVSEWVEDCWSINYINLPTDGSAWNGGDCSLRVIRGGSWDSEPRFMRSAFRDRETADVRNFFSGFRIARDLDERELKASNTNQPKQVALVAPSTPAMTSPAKPAVSNRPNQLNLSELVDKMETLERDIRTFNVQLVRGDLEADNLEKPLDKLMYETTFNRDAIIRIGAADRNSDALSPLLDRIQRLIRDMRKLRVVISRRSGR